MLRLQNRKLFLRRDGVGLRRGEGCLGLQQAGRILLGLLDGARATFDQAGVALFLLLREGQGRLRLHGLLLGLVDTGLLCGDLGFDIGHVGLACSTCAVA